MKFKLTPKMLIPVVLILLIIGGIYYFHTQTEKKMAKGFDSGNGRIEATEVDIAAKQPGRVEKILVDEGDYVKEGQLLAVMQTNTLEAQIQEAEAQLQKAQTSEKSAIAQVAVNESNKRVSQAMLLQRESDLDAAQRRYNRSKLLVGKGAVSVEEFDDDETNLNSAKAAVASAKAQVSVNQAAIDAANADVNSRRADIKAAEAQIIRIKTDLDDCYLTAPRSGRIQYRVARPGEVLGAGGKLLNLVDLTDVYMTFYLPEMTAGQIALNSDARIVLDAFPNEAVPARITYVASVAQFTPKTVETEVERQKLMFRVKANIYPQYLQERVEYVKTGLPGVTWVRVDPNVDWPQSLALKEYK